MTLPAALRRQRILIVIAILALGLALAWSARPQAESSAERVDRITSVLRCVVCQGLSVKDSPAESARQMRDRVVQRVEEGRSDQQIVDEFRASYGDWVVLSPPLLSWAALVWLVPIVAVLVGATVAWRWLRTPPQSLPEPPASDVTALRERVAREEALDLPLQDTP